MKKVIKAAKSKGSISEKELLRLLEKAENALRQNCEDRGLNEYIDDSRWGTDTFAISIYVDNGLSESGRPDTELVTDFIFRYDPDDVEERSASRQLDDALEEFIDQRDMAYDDYYEDDDDDELTGEEYIQNAISDIVHEAYEVCNNDPKYSFSKIVDYIVKRLHKVYGFVLDEEYTKDEILAEMDEYFWKAQPSD